MGWRFGINDAVLNVVLYNSVNDVAAATAIEEHKVTTLAVAFADSDVVFANLRRQRQLHTNVGSRQVRAKEANDQPDRG